MSDRIEPATSGSYGVQPSAFRLPEATHLSAVTLQVSNLARSRQFYEQTLGFSTLRATDTEVTLGTRGSTSALVSLIERRHSPPPSGRKRLGLFHFAILLPNRADLGRFLRHLEQQGVQAGAGDHFVSEALYLHDPDNLGIEVYADRPRASWTRRGQELVMGTDPLDVGDLLESGGSARWAGVPAGTTIGHVHLHVGDIDTASCFFSEGVGFDRMVWSYPGALFLGAGGYHHHLGTNIWAGPAAQAPAPDEPQLLEWTIVVPSAAEVTAAAANLRAVGFAAELTPDNRGCITRDPWGTALRIVAATP